MTATATVTRDDSTGELVATVTTDAPFTGDNERAAAQLAIRDAMFPANTSRVFVQLVSDGGTVSAWRVTR